MGLVITIVFGLLFLYILLSVTYLAVFAFAARFVRTKREGNYDWMPSYLILIPAYKEDRVIIESATSALEQKYDRARFEVVVVADKMQPVTIDNLRLIGATVLEVDFEHSTKAKAINFALKEASPKDRVVILDADNIVESDYLLRISRRMNKADVVLQTHRKAKNSNTPYALLDAVSEEINNSIFRKGHVALGCASALIGSGMVFRYDWLADNMPRVSSVGEDKELEFMLLDKKIFVDYADDIPVYDHKVERPTNFYNQRRRWLAAQFSLLSDNVNKLPKALREQNIDLIFKIFEQMMLPRVLLVFATTLLTILSFVLCRDMFGLWLGVWVVLMMALIISVPQEMWNRKLWQAVLKIPLMALLMFANMFRLRGATKKFIHTENKS